MKKSKTMRFAGMLLVLTLITSCFVGGTFAKYTVGSAAEASARVAKFGIELGASSEDIFGTAYAETAAEEGKDEITALTNYTVKSEENVVAPGTKGEFTLFSLDTTGTDFENLEVAVKVTATLDNAEHLNMITLPVKSGYDDVTTAGGDDTFNVDSEDYNPIKWKLTKDGTQVASGNLAAINTYLEGTLSNSYYPNDYEGMASGAKTFTDDLKPLLGTYKLSWEWPIGSDEDTHKKDTYLGMVMAGTHTDGTVTDLTEAFNFKITVEQID